MIQVLILQHAKPKNVFCKLQKLRSIKTRAATSPSRLGSFNGLTGSQLFIGIGAGVELACALQRYHPSHSVHGLEHFGIKVAASLLVLS